MAFPVSPTNGQQSTIANVVYQYASATNSWTVIPGYANSITATGNVSANYFVGNGAALTGVTATGATALTYGTTNITTAPSGNANITIAGTSNVAVFSTGGANVTGYVTATGNVTGNYIFGNGALLTGVITSVANINSGTSNVTVVSSGGNVTVGIAGTGNVVVFSTGGVNVAGYVTATANVTGGNLITTGLVSASGTITGSSFSGAGTGLTGTASSLTVGTATVAGTVTTAAQPNITSVGTLSSLSVTGNITSSTGHVGTIYTNSIINTGANGTGNIGSSSLYFNTAFVKATSAQYADLAEMYVADNNYPSGTVVEFGGEYEITLTTQSHSTAVAGIISTDPSYLMNSTQAGEHVLPVALTGRVPCQVLGPVNKGDVLVSSHIPGVAQRIGINWQPGCVLGKSMEKISNNEIKTIEVAVGRL